MFDDFHDPDPPIPGLDTLAAVTARARRTRQRRVLMACRAGLAGVIAIVAIATIPRIGGDRDDDNDMVLVDSSTVTTSAPPNPTPSSSAPPSTSTAPTTTDVPGIAPPPSTSAAPGTSPPDSAALTSSSSPTSPAVPTASSIVAIDGNGDAVLVEPDGSVTVLYDGVDPDDPQLAVGDDAAVDGVAAVRDRSRAFVGLCCEPIAGSIRDWPPVPGSSQFSHGYAPVLSPDEQSIGVVMAEEVSLFGLDGQFIAGLPIDVDQGSPTELAFVDDDSLAILVTGPESSSIQIADRAGDTFEVRITIDLGPTSPAVARLSLTGVDERTLLVLDTERSVILTYDWWTGEQIGEWDGGEFGGIPDATHISFDGAALRYVDSSRRLFVNGEQVPGEYIWVG